MTQCREVLREAQVVLLTELSIPRLIELSYLK
jgi:hypothetical protein